MPAANLCRVAVYCVNHQLNEVNTGCVMVTDVCTTFMPQLLIVTHCVPSVAVVT